MKGKSGYSSIFWPSSRHSIDQSCLAFYPNNITQLYSVCHLSFLSSSLSLTKPHPQLMQHLLLFLMRRYRSLSHTSVFILSGYNALTSFLIHGKCHCRNGFCFFMPFPWDTITIVLIYASPLKKIKMRNCNTTWKDVYMYVCTNHLKNVIR